MSKATMALSQKQALAVASSVGVAVPKGSGSVKFGNVTLRRLSAPFRKHKANAQAFRLTAPNHADLSQFHSIVDGAGRSVCIVWKNDDEA